MVAHVIAIETVDSFFTGLRSDDGRCCRWRCSCDAMGDWKPSRRKHSAARRARDGGARHVAAMERGKP